MALPIHSAPQAAGSPGGRTRRRVAEPSHGLQRPPPGQVARRREMPTGFFAASRSRRAGSFGGAVLGWRCVAVGQRRVEDREQQQQQSAFPPSAHFSFSRLDGDGRNLQGTQKHKRSEDGYRFADPEILV